MKNKSKEKIPPPLSLVTLDALEAWLACRLRWQLARTAPSAEPPPAEHLQKCVRKCVRFVHRERAAGRNPAFASVQEHFWETFERQSLETSQSYPPGERARDMREGEAVLERYVAETQAEPRDCVGTEVGLAVNLPGAKQSLIVRADLLHPGPTPVTIQVVRSAPDPGLVEFRFAPWSAAVSLALRAHFGRAPGQTEAVFLVLGEAPKVVRLHLPPPAPETFDKLQLWINAFTRAMATGEVFPQPGVHCADCAFRAACAHWPAKG